MHETNFYRSAGRIPPEEAKATTKTERGSRRKMAVVGRLKKKDNVKANRMEWNLFYYFSYYLSFFEHRYMDASFLLYIMNN